MFTYIWNAIKEVFSRPPLRAQFEELLLQEDAARNEAVEQEAARLREEAEQARRAEEAKKQAAEAAKAKAIEDRIAAYEANLKAQEQAATAAVETQITDAVTEAKPKRARNVKGRLVADDPTTTDTNEAWVGGKAPVKTTGKKGKSSKKKKKNK